MNNLIRVSTKRMWKSTIFIVALAVTFALSIYYANVKGNTYLQWVEEGEDYVLENFFFQLAPLLGIVFGSFVSLFVGVEYSDGTLRNKLIAGNSRSSVFLSIFVASCLGCLLINLVWLLGSCAGFLYFNSFAFGWKAFFMYVLVSLAIAAAMAAINTTIAMLIPSKAVSAVVTLVLWIVLLFAGSALVNMLDAPPTTFNYVQQGIIWVPTEEIPNPAYIGGAKRVVFEALVSINPLSQGIRIAGAEVEKPFNQIAFSLGTTVVFLAGGCAVFRKKDLK